MREVGQGLGHNIAVTLYVFSFSSVQLCRTFRSCYLGFSVKRSLYTFLFIFSDMNVEMKAHIHSHSHTLVSGRIM